jgi:hypothetical protein
MYYVAIPSLGRSEILVSQTLNTLDKHGINKDIITIFVIPEEYETYKTATKGKYKIVVGVKGLIQQRNFIENYYKPNDHIVFLDDDIKSIDLSMSMVGSLHELFTEAYEDCKHYKSYIWSVYPVYNPFFREKREELSTCLNICIGAFYGIINRPNDKELKHVLQNDNKEDTERSILYFKKDGIVLRYDRIAFKTKYYGNTGGMGTLAQRMPQIIESTKILKDQYAEYGSVKIRRSGIYEFVLKKKQSVDMDREVIKLPVVEKSLFDNVYRMLEGVKFSTKVNKSNRRGFPKHNALVLGITRQRYSGKIGPSVATKRNPEILNELKRLVNIINPGFQFNAVHINHNLVCPSHKDETNVGKSMIISIGEYEGCTLIVNGEECNTHYRPVLFNGSVLEHHNTDDLKGNKYSIVFYLSPYSMGSY